MVTKGRGSNVRSWSLALACLLGMALPHSVEAGKVRFGGDGEASAHAYNPVWSLDGRYLAFESNRYTGDVDLYVTETSGEIARTPTRISLPGGSNPFGGSGQVVANAAWHPQVVVFEGSNQGGIYRLYYYQPGGGAASELITTTEIGGNLTFPSLARDGSAALFVSSSSGNGDIYMRDTDSSRITQITRTDGSESFPMFSADKSKVLFSRKNRNSEAIFQLDLRSNEESIVVSANGDQTRPAYAANGQVVYFTSERGEDLWDLAAIGADGSGKRTLGRNVRLPLRSRPALDPAGQWVAYGSNDPEHEGGITLVAVDGSRTVEIRTEFKACAEPALTRQGDKLLLAFTALPASGSDWRFLYVMDITGRI